MQISKLDGKKLSELGYLANKTTDAIIASGKNHSQAMAAHFAAGDLVWGIWPDVMSPHGARAAILKGRGTLMLVSQGKRGMAIKEVALRFREEAEAAAACQVWGDDRANAA